MAESALHSSAGFNSVEDLRREIASGLDINAIGTNGWTPLHRACIATSYEAAKILLEAGADVTLLDKWGNNALWHAFVRDDDTQGNLVQLLTDYGSDPTVENNHGNSTLGMAKKLQKTKYLEIFANAGHS